MARKRNPPCDVISRMIGPEMGASVMLTLLPNEHWDYDILDAVRELRTAFFSERRNERRIYIPGVGSCRAVRSGRAAIVIALKSLGLSRKAPVGVPLYCCPVVFKAIKVAGYVPRFIDVDPETYCLSASDLAAKNKDVEAVIPVHMFGNLCDMPALRQAAPGKPFIEDCAQALGSEINGRMAGSFSEIAIFSFRSGKYLSVGEGAALYSGDKSLDRRISETISALPVPSRIDECVHVGATYLRSRLRSRPLWGMLGTLLWQSYSARVSYSSQSRLVLEQVYETDRDLARRRLQLLSTWIKKQRSNAHYYEQNLRVMPKMLCREFPGAFFNRLQYPLLLPTSGHCDRIAQNLRDNQISTGRPYKEIATIAAKHYGYSGDCPKAERIAKTVLVIPCNHTVRAADVARITQCINRWWSSVSGLPCHMDVSDVASEMSSLTQGH